MRRSFELGQLQPVDGRTIVPTIFAGAPGGGVVAAVVALGYDDDGGAPSCWAINGVRPFWIVWPTTPPIRAATIAMKSPIMARIHHRIHPLRVVVGVELQSTIGGWYSAAGG